MTDQNRERFEAWWYGWNGVRTRYAHYTFLGVSEESAKDIWQAATSARPTAQGVQALADAVAWLRYEEVNAGPRTLKSIGVVLDHLDALSQAGSAPEAREPLTEEQIIAAKRGAVPLDPTQRWGETLAFARAIERAHGIAAKQEGTEV